MFTKITTSSITIDDIEILDSELIKTAAIKLPDNIKYDPDFLYMKLRAVSAGEVFGCNKNSDWFSENELKAWFQTFLNAHVFKNHENKDIANAIGDVLSVEYDEYMHGVILIVRIDKKIAPSIVRGFEKGFMTDVSMGCRIDYSVCSICGNKAKTAKQYCDHILHQRGKIYEDGRKVYEINVGPKFHDISTVLNGAEKVAKVTGFYIDNGKLAFNIANNDHMEKAASFSEAFTESSAEEKIAEQIDKDFLPEIKLSKKAYVQKFAEIKKDIEARILDLANQDVAKDFTDESDLARSILRSMNEEYLDDGRCQEIADKLINLADERDQSPEKIFDQFLKATDFLGVELSPKEFDIISSRLFEKTPSGVSEIDDDPVSSFMNFDNHMNENLKAMETVSPVKDLISVGSILKRNPISFESSFLPSPKVSMIVVKLGKPETQGEDFIHDIVNILKPDIQRRSFYSPYMFKKAENISNNSDQFKFGNLFKEAAYSVYQKNRVARIDDDDFAYKVASYAGSVLPVEEDLLLTKQASVLGKGYTSRKAMVYGLPLTYGYSAYQRSRLNNGENISSFNRYVAENPASAYAIQSLLGPLVYRKTSGIPSAVGYGLRAAAKGAGKMFKKASEKDNLIFDDKGIEQKISEVYSPKQIAALRAALVLTDYGRQDAADQILKKENLTEDDVAAFSKKSKDLIKDKINSNFRKQASVIAEAVQGAMLRPEGRSILAEIPGDVAGTIMFSLALKQLDKYNQNKNDKMKKENS